ncbi:MAG: hypothetical protein ACRDHP_20670, partial [Ktedonobacterales bacterium]
MSSGEPGVTEALSHEDYGALAARIQAVRERIASAATGAGRAPEQVTLVLPLAGPTSRMLAYAVDYTVILVLQIVAIILLVLA